MSSQVAYFVQRLRQAGPQRHCPVAPSLWRPRRSAESHRATPSCLGVSTRLCHIPSTPSPTESFTTPTFASPATTAPAPIRDRFVCPECGKRFLCVANLLQHRTTRHGLHVVTPQETARAALIARNGELQRELTRLRARVRLLTDERASTTTANTADNGAPSKSYPSAVLTGQLMEVDAAVEGEWRRTGKALGTGVSFVNCVGTVVDTVQLGTLAGAAAAPTHVAPRVLQFSLESHGYQERRPGQLKMYRAQMLVRYLPAQRYHERRTPAAAAAALFGVRVGDVVRVQGHYALHNSYDMVTKLPVENVVVEADAVGLLHRPTPATAVEESTSPHTAPATVSLHTAVPAPAMVAGGGEDASAVPTLQGEAARVRRAASLPAAPTEDLDTTVKDGGGGGVASPNASAGTSSKRSRKIKKRRHSKHAKKG